MAGMLAAGHGRQHPCNVAVVSMPVHVNCCLLQVVEVLEAVNLVLADSGYSVLLGMVRTCTRCVLDCGGLGCVWVLLSQLHAFAAGPRLGVF